MPSKVISIFLQIIGFPTYCLAVDMGRILPAETRAGSLTAPTQTDAFFFDGTAGTGLAILLSEECSSSAFEPELRLLAPGTSALEASDWGYQSAEIENHRLLHSGTYTILVKERDGDASCEYSLSLLLMPGTLTSEFDRDGRRLYPADNLVGAISLRSDTDAFTFEGEANTGIVIAVSEECSSSAFEPEVRLYGPAGFREASQWGYKSAEIENHILHSTGLYTILVKERDGDATCNYSLSLIIISESSVSSSDLDGGDLLSGDNAVGSITVRADIDAFTFIGTIGDTLVIAMSEECSSSSFEPELRLYGPLGLREVADWDYEGALIGGHHLQHSGHYTIIAKERDGDATCAYSLSALLIPGPTVSALDRDGGRIDSGQTVHGAIDWRADTDAFALIGRSNDAVNITLSEGCSSSSFEPEVLLYDPRGLLEASDWDYDGAEIASHQLRYTGLYTIVARERDGDATCSYTISLTKIPPHAGISCTATLTATGPADPGEFSFTTVVSGSEGPYTYDWSFGEGSFSDSSSPVFTYSKNGRFHWYLIVRADDGQACVEYGTVQVDTGEIFSDSFESGSAVNWSSAGSKILHLGPNW